MDDQSQTLTSPAYWDEYWQQRALPSEIRKGQSLYLDELIKVFETHLPRGESRTALEIGGAPGGYLAFMHRGLATTSPCSTTRSSAAGWRKKTSSSWTFLRLCLMEILRSRRPPAALRSRFLARAD